MFLCTHPPLCSLPYFLEYNYMEFLTVFFFSIENITVEVSTKNVIFQVKLVKIIFIQAHAMSCLLVLELLPKLLHMDLIKI